MKVMILVPGLPLNIDDIKGGVHSAVINLLTGFQKKDIIVRLVSLNDDIKENTNLQFSKNIDIVYLNEGNYPFHSFNYFINGSSLIKKEIKKFNPDIIHFEEGNSFLLTKFFGLHKKPYLLTMHGMAFAESRAQKKISDKINLYFNGIIQSGFHPANIIHLSEYSLNLHPFSKKSQCCIISNAVNLSFFNVPPKKLMDNSLLYIGVINERKNLMFLLEALKNLLLQNIQYSLTVIGGFADDLYKQKVLNYIKENNLDNRVHLKGWVPQSVVKNYIAASDILVLPSKQETLPMVIAECMGAAKVVVASDVGGIGEMIDNGVTGYLFNNKNTLQLENILTNLYCNSDKLQKVSMKAREVAIIKYHCENIADKTISFYNEILNRRI